VYPAEEINDLLRLAPQQRESVEATLSYFDAARHAPSVTASTLLVDANSTLVRALGGPVEEYALTHRGAIDHAWLDAWLAGKMNSEPRVRFLEATL
jgi:cephalosporin-C deacetylase-like acetyl esterase